MWDVVVGKARLRKAYEWNFGILMAVTIKRKIMWDMTPWILVEIHQILVK